MTSFRQVFKGLELIHKRTADNAAIFSQPCSSSDQTVFGVLYDDRLIGPVDKMALEGWGWDLHEGRMQITF